MLTYNVLVPVTHGLCHCNPKPVTVTCAPILQREAGGVGGWGVGGEGGWGRKGAKEAMMAKHIMRFVGRSC